MNDSRFPPASKTDSRRSLVEACFRREAGSAASIPADSVDLLEAGILDSMAWVSFLRAVETASGVSDLGSGLNERAASLGEVLAALQNSASEISGAEDASLDQKISLSPAQAVLTGSSAVPGSRLLPSEEVDRAFGMPAGKLRSRAGIESLAYAAEGENELTLAATAAQEALRAASCGTQEMDWIIATSETHHDYPSLSAQLHSRLLVRENCGALDVGGACLGLLNALTVAQSLIGSGQARTILVATADVHSRTLTPGRVAGEFGGLFGDGASAFILRSAAGGDSHEGYRLGDFLFGCAGQYAAAIQVNGEKNGGLTVQFDGEALSRAAITRMEKILAADGAAQRHPAQLRRRFRNAPAKSSPRRPSRKTMRCLAGHFSAHRQDLRQSRLVHLRRGPPRSLAERFEATARPSPSHFSCLARSRPPVRWRLAHTQRWSCPLNILTDIKIKTRAPHPQASRL
jgi:3-oxoacyl-[acyl-carrier-protein] synthase III